MLAPYANAKWQQRADRLAFLFFFEQERMSGPQYEQLLAQLNGAIHHLIKQALRCHSNRLACQLGTDDPYHRPKLSAWHELYGKEPARHQGILVPVKRRY